MRRLGIVAVGLALVVGVVVGGIIGNSFDGKASASTAAVGGRLISLGTQTVGDDWQYHSPMVEVSDCSSMKLMARAPQGETSGLQPDSLYTSPDGVARMGVGNEWPGPSPFEEVFQSALDGFATLYATVGRMPLPYAQFNISAEPGATVTAWVWCATTTSPSYAVGGIAELPALAGPAGTSGMGGATYAVLAGAAAGVLAFAVLATLSVKRWRVR